jgi:hypothetical protein
MRFTSHSRLSELFRFAVSSQCRKCCWMNGALFPIAVQTANSSFSQACTRLQTTLACRTCVNCIIRLLFYKRFGESNASKVTEGQGTRVSRAFHQRNSFLMRVPATKGASCHSLRLRVRCLRRRSYFRRQLQDTSYPEQFKSLLLVTGLSDDAASNSAHVVSRGRPSNE